MRPRRLRSALAALLAAFALGAAFAPPHASADAPAADAGAIATRLLPGWNLVGWIGPDTPSRQAFERLPALARIEAWDSEEQRYLIASRGRYGKLPTLTPGMGLWMLVRGSAPVEWTRPVAPDGVLLEIRPGRNLVAWADRRSAPFGDAAARFGDALTRAWTWDAADQRFRRLLPASGEPSAPQAGDAVWIEASSAFRWWQPGAGEPPIAFHGDIPAGDRAAIRAEYEAVRTHFAERFGVVAKSEAMRRAGFGIHVGPDWDALRTVYAEVFGEELEPDPSNCGRYWNGPSGYRVEVALIPCVNTEDIYVPALVAVSHADGPESPEWLTRGTSAYARTVYLVTSGELDREWARKDQTTPAKITTVPLAHPEARMLLGYLAVELLAQRAGEDALFEYYRVLPSAASWRDAFRTAFGMSADDFYRAFERYRRETAPPWPHLTDGRNGPALVFLDDIPAEKESELRDGFLRAWAFFHERFGADDPASVDVTIYVGQGRNAVSAAVPEKADLLCGPSFFAVAIALDECGDPPLHDRYWINLILTPHDKPGWLAQGTETYATAVFRAAAGHLDLARRRAAYVDDMARYEAHSLRDGDIHWAAAEALGFLAAEWLAARAGEPALFEYHRNARAASRDPAPQWQDTFRTVFGLTLEEFHVAFEAHLAALIESDPLP